MKSILSLRPGQKGRISSLLPGSEVELRKFMALGLLPGVEVEILQVSPAYVLQVDFTQLAFDRQTASKIVVEPLASI